MDIRKFIGTGGMSYLDLQGNTTEFTPQDVEMAIFSWATKNSEFFINR